MKTPRSLGLSQIQAAGFIMLCTDEGVRPYYDNAFELIFSELRRHFACEVAKALAERGEIEAIGIVNECLNAPREAKT